MRVLRITLAVAALALLALGATACGGDSEDEDQITEAIEASATTTDPSKCTEFQTAAFNEQQSGASGDEALQVCQNGAGDAPADSVEVDAIEIDGDSATAEVAISGSVIDGSTLAVDLVKEDDDWKLDRFTDFVEFDRDSFDQALEEQLRADSEVPAKAADCVLERVAELSDERAQNFVLFPAAVSEEIFLPCFQGG